MKTNSQQIFIAKNKTEACKKAAESIKSAIEKKSALSLGIASGKTMIPLYNELAKTYRKKEISFKKIKVFGIDEYLGLQKKDKNSFYQYFQRNFFSKVDLEEKNINFLNSETKNPERECLDYEKKIKSVNGIDILLLGLGVNCHIAFNEPGSSIKSKTRIVKLSKETRKYLSRSFNSAPVPKKALTIGISTILSAKKIILLATGEKKKTAVKKTIYARVSEKFPSTFLRKHEGVTFIFDKKSFSGNKSIINFI